jgi:hypothetical protein
MGFFSRRKDKESALSQADMSAAQVGTAPPQEPNPAVSAPAPSLGIGQAPTGGIAQEVDAATGGDIQRQMAGLMSLMSQHAVDLRSQPMEVREAVAADCRAQGVDMKVGQALNITDPQQIHTVVEVLKKHDLLPANVNVN